MIKNVLFGARRSHFCAYLIIGHVGVLHLQVQDLIKSGIRFGQIGELEHYITEYYKEVLLTGLHNEFYSIRRDFLTNGFLKIHQLIRRAGILIYYFLESPVCIIQLGVLIGFVGFSGQKTGSARRFFIGFTFVLLNVEIRTRAVHIGIFRRVK